MWVDRRGGGGGGRGLGREEQGAFSEHKVFGTSF